jgi:hypothetical protein
MYPRSRSSHQPEGPRLTRRSYSERKPNNGLDAFLTFVRNGDTVVAHSMDRLTRNLDDVRHIVQELANSGVVSSSKECVTFTRENLLTGECDAVDEGDLREVRARTNS